MSGSRSETSRSSTNGLGAASVIERVPPVRLLVELLILAAVVSAWTSGAAAKFGTDLAFDRPDLKQTQRLMTLQWMRGVVPANASVVAWFAGEASDDLMLVCRFDGREPGPIWSETMVLWNRSTVPGLLVGIPEQPIDVPSPNASLDAWRLFLMDARVRILPLERVGALRRVDPSFPAIGRPVPIDPCLD